MTVIVPHPEKTGQLVFCNTWTEAPWSWQHWQPIRFCEIYKSQGDKGVESWEGWENVFQEMNHAHAEFMSYQ